MSIVIVGMGPGNPSHLTVEAHTLLREAGRVYARTGRHPTVDYLRAAGVDVQTFDAVYEEHERLPDVYAAIAQRIVSLAGAGGEAGPVVFAVPGHPLVAESTTALILELAGREAVRLVDGMSFVEPTITALGVDLLRGVQVVDGLDLVLQPFPMLDTDRDALIAQVYSREVASEVKLMLGQLYPDEHAVTLVQAAGTSEQRVAHMPLFEIDRWPGVDHLTTLYVPALPYEGSWLGLQKVVARLRAPGGCPWDREQTHSSLRTHLLDETYEVLDALDHDNATELAEELGDLALQIALHIEIAREEGEFTPTDVFSAISAKLRRRHPHVFGDVEVSGAGEVLVNWEQIKQQERGEHTNVGALSGVPRGLPALAQARTYQERAERVGYVGEGEPTLDGCLQEWAQAAGEAGPGVSERRFGRLLFALVAEARRHGIDPESALREVNREFGERFSSGPAEGPAAPQGDVPTKES